MDAINFIRALSFGNFRTTLTEFQRQWKFALRHAHAGPDYAEAFFSAAFATQLGTERLPFTPTDNLSPVEQKDQARFYVREQSLRWSEKVCSNTVYFPPEHLLRAFAGFDMLDITPPTDFFKLWKATSLAHMRSMNPLQLTQVAKKLSQHALYPSDEWMDAWTDTVCQQADDFDDPNIYDAVYALAILDRLRPRMDEHDSPYRDMALSMLDYVAKSLERKGEHVAKSQIYFAALWFGHDLIERSMCEVEDTNVSKIERDVAAVLQALDIPSYPDDFVISGMGHKVDLCRVYNNAVFALEVDGAYHFKIDVEQRLARYDGSTRIQSSFIDRMSDDNVRILRVPASVCSIFNKTPQCWVDLFRQASRLTDPSIHIVHPSSELRPIHDDSAWEFPIKDPYRWGASFRAPR